MLFQKCVVCTKFDIYVLFFPVTFNNSMTTYIYQRFKTYVQFQLNIGIALAFIYMPHDRSTGYIYKLIQCLPVGIKAYTQRDIFKTVYKCVGFCFFFFGICLENLTLLVCKQHYFTIFRVVVADPLQGKVYRIDALLPFLFACDSRRIPKEPISQSHIFIRFNCQ